MKMKIKEIKVENYRCIDKFEIKKVKPITIFVGRNNTGKSSILESLALAISGENCWNSRKKGGILEDIIRKRGGPNELKNIINYNSNNCRIRIKGDRLNSELSISKNFEEFSNSVRSVELSSILKRFENLFINDIKSDLRDTISEKIKTDNEIDKEIVMKYINKKIEELKDDLLEKFSIYISYRNEMSGVKNYAFLGGCENIKKSINEIRNYLEENFELKDIFLRSISKINDIIKISFRDNKEIGKDKRIIKMEYLREISYSKLKGLFKKIMRNKTYFNNYFEMLKRNYDHVENVIIPNGEIYLHIKNKSEMVHIKSFGDGFISQMFILALIILNKNGVILIEEPENNKHPGYLGILANEIINSVERMNIQYFISTHNIEFIDFLLEINPEIIKLIRLYRDEKEFGINYEILDGTEAIEELRELRLDLRGI
ncbi:MAG: AAA family ATPase [Candidatus Helarchaeota archaeon]